MTTIQKSLPVSEQIRFLEKLASQLQTAQSIEEKIRIIDKLPHVADFMKSMQQLDKTVDKLSPPGQYAVKVVLAIGQGHIVFDGWNAAKEHEYMLDALIESLLEVEKFYDTMGGIVGYQLTILKLIADETAKKPAQGITYDKPEGLDICATTDEVKETIRWGIEAMRHMGEIYPLGGAGDRLNLHDESTGELLPAAQLQFCGRTLLEGLIRDLQGKEYLYYKLFGKQLITPIAMMTSNEKNNNQRLTDLCEEHEWFGRPHDSYFLFRQPLVPMVTVDGEWVMADILKLHLKPGGHGAIWKVAEDSHVFSWFKEHHRNKVLIRQINNPVAGTDNGLFCLAGIGSHKNKDFGFASCHRLLNTPEGMDVLKGVKGEDGYEYCITNVEYTEFKHCGIEDVSESPGSAYSRFPSNTNILFGDLAAIKEAVKRCPLPGILLNMKNKVLCRGVEKLAGRLESTMQNIADYIVDNFEGKPTKEQSQGMRTFLTYNDRRKTISVVKQSYEPGKSIVGTPEGCFYDMISNYRDLLSSHCGMEVPPEQDEKDFISQGPNFIAHFHPALGMLYSVIGQKIRKGKIAEGAELVLEVAEADISNLDLNGSLIIEADSVMGRKDQRGVNIFDGENSGKCTLTNVKVKNLGYGTVSVQDAWQNKVQRSEALRITLQGNGEFMAEDVELSGDMHFVVPRGHRLVVYHQGKEVAWHFEKIAHATWKWDYTFDSSNNICLEKVKAAR